jgi:hypothetical protein
LKDWKHLEELKGKVGIVKLTGIPSPFRLLYPPVMKITPFSRAAPGFSIQTRGGKNRIGPFFPVDDKIQKEPKTNDYMN